MHLAEDFPLGADGFGGRELPPGVMLLSRYKLELPAGDACLEPGPNLCVGGLTHAASQRITVQVALVRDSFTLEAAVASIGDGLPGNLPRILIVTLGRMCLDALPRFRHNLIRLVSELRSDLAVCSQYLRWRVDLFAVAGGVCGD